MSISKPKISPHTANSFPNEKGNAQGTVHKRMASLSKNVLQRFTNLPRMIRGRKRVIEMVEETPTESKGIVSEVLEKVKEMVVFTPVKGVALEEEGIDAAQEAEMFNVVPSKDEKEPNDTIAKLSTSLKSPTNKGFEAGSHEEGRFSRGGQPLFQMEKFKESQQYQGVHQNVFNEWVDAEAAIQRRPYFSLEDMQGNSISFNKEPSQASSFLKALAKWDNGKSLEEAFTKFSLDREITILQILLVQYLQCPLTPSEEKLYVEISGFQNSLWSEQPPPHPFQVKETRIKLLPEHKIEVTWQIKLGESEEFAVSQTIQIRSQGEQRPCWISMQRDLTTTPSK